MAEWDPQSGKLRATWTVSFSPWWVLVGSLIGGVVTGAMVVFGLIGSSEEGTLNDSTSVAQGGLLLFGMIVAGFLLLGPLLGWGLGFALRNYENQMIHVVGFAVLGLIVGGMIGPLVGLGAVLAPATGVGAAAGRWAISGAAKS